MDWDCGRDGVAYVSAFSPLNWLALNTDVGRLPLRDWLSAPWLREADAGRSTKREIRSSRSCLFSERLGIGDIIWQRLLDLNKLRNSFTCCVYL